MSGKVLVGEDVLRVAIKYIDAIQKVEDESGSYVFHAVDNIDITNVSNDKRVARLVFRDDIWNLEVSG